METVNRRWKRVKYSSLIQFRPHFSGETAPAASPADPYFPMEYKKCSPRNISRLPNGTVLQCFYSAPGTKRNISAVARMLSSFGG